jgi:hypothetical protein
MSHGTDVPRDVRDALARVLAGSHAMDMPRTTTHVEMPRTLRC